MREILGTLPVVLLIVVTARGGLGIGTTMPVNVPPGAAALGYTKCVINEIPTAAEVAPGRKGTSAYRLAIGGQGPDVRRALVQPSSGTPQSATPRAVCTFQCISLYWTPEGGAEDKPCQVYYRPRVR